MFKGARTLQPPAVCLDSSLSGLCSTSSHLSSIFPPFSLHSSPPVWQFSWRKVKPFCVRLETIWWSPGFFAFSLNRILGKRLIGLILNPNSLILQNTLQDFCYRNAGRIIVGLVRRTQRGEGGVTLVPCEIHWCISLPEYWDHVGILIKSAFSKFYLIFCILSFFFL